MCPSSRPFPLHQLKDPLVALSLAIVVIGVGCLLSFGYGRDQGIYALIGEGILRGEVPYKDLWDVKPPGIFLLFALSRALFGASTHAIRVLEAGCLLSLLAAFPILSARFNGSSSAGYLAAAIAILAHAQLEFWHTAQPEGFGGVAVAWGLVLLTAAPLRRPSPGPRPAARLAAAGLLGGLALLMKPPLGGSLIAAFGVLAFRADGHWGRPALRELSRPVTAFGAGLVLPCLAASGWIALGGGWDDMTRTLFGFAPAYAGLDFDASWIMELSLRAVEQCLFWFSVYIPLGLSAALLARPQGRRSEGLLLIAAAITPQLLGVAIQGKFIPYHYAGAIPLAGLAAAWGLWGIWERARAGRLAATGLLAGLLLAGAVVTPTQMEEGDGYRFWPRVVPRWKALLSPRAARPVRDRLDSHYDVDAASNRRVAEWLSASTPDGSRLFVWGFEPTIYLWSGRRPASRYIQNQPLRHPWGREAARAGLMKELREEPPSAIVIQHGDVLPALTGDRLDSAASLGGFPELVGFIQEGYRPAARIGDFEIHVRR